MVKDVRLLKEGDILFFDIPPLEKYKIIYINGAGEFHPYPGQPVSVYKEFNQVTRKIEFENLEDNFVFEWKLGNSLELRHFNRCIKYPSLSAYVTSRQ